LKNNRREFIKKSTTLAALSLVGMGADIPIALSISDQKAFTKVEKSKVKPVEPYMKGLVERVMAKG